ncbi:hypothetical protein BDB01DRAFT_805385 [Pilobolus umbonatus]|nr:hypothetical protein BDB01DRAFT_805385 [Pilobolus umbonatus]
MASKPFRNNKGYAYVAHYYTIDFISKDIAYCWQEKVDKVLHSGYHPDDDFYKLAMYKLAAPHFYNHDIMTALCNATKFKELANTISQKLFDADINLGVPVQQEQINEINKTETTESKKKKFELFLTAGSLSDKSSSSSLPETKPPNEKEGE